MMKWFAVYTQAGKEAMAARELGNQNFGIYLPLYQKMRRHAGRTSIVDAPLFPRYLFVGIDTETQRWRSVNGPRGVVGLVSFGQNPSPIPEIFIAQIRAREDDTGYIRLNSTGFQHGQPLRIVGGAMAETEGLFEKVVDSDRAILLVSLLGQLVRTELPLSLVEAA